MTGDGTAGIDEDLARRVEHRQEWIACIRALHGSAQLFGAGSVGVALVIGVFPDIKSPDNEVFIHDRTCRGVLEERLKHLTRTTPGRAEYQQDIFVFGCSLAFGLQHDLIRIRGG